MITRHDVLRALSFLARQNSNGAEKVKEVSLEIREQQLDRFIYDRALRSKKYEYEISWIMKKFG